MTSQSDLICLGAWLVIALVTTGIYLLYFRREPVSHDAIMLDPESEDSEGQYIYDESVFIEAGSIVEQRKSGRERGGPVILNYRKDPQDFSAQLNLKSFKGERMVINDRSDS